MAHKVSLREPQCSQRMRGNLELGFGEDGRTKGRDSVNTRSPLMVSSFGPIQEKDSRYCVLEDVSCGYREERMASRRQPTEGHKEQQQLLCEQDISSVSSVTASTVVRGSSGSPGDGAAEGAEASVMDPVDPTNNRYSSDEWEESDLSDTDGDHSDSSDDDDPKSQVDRLIERGTLMYMDGENSNLSSETDSSDSSSDYEDSDSESDITDVSPLISATASPLGLSPVLPRRTLGTSPLALHDNRELSVECQGHLPPPPLAPVPHQEDYLPQPHCNGLTHTSNQEDSTDMTLLLKAVVELEKKQHRQIGNRSSDHNHHHHHHQHNPQHHYQLNQQSTPPITIHHIHANPHHTHLRRSNHQRRKNMSFTNDEVRRIDRDNQILLHKIMSAHTRNTKAQCSSSSFTHNTRPVHKPANSTVNRKREEEKIRRENVILLRKIQEAKPSQDVSASRSPRQRTAHGFRPTSSLPTTPGSCGASARNLRGHVTTPTPRKETAL